MGTVCHEKGPSQRLNKKATKIKIGIHGISTTKTKYDEKNFFTVCTSSKILVTG